MCYMVLAHARVKDQGCIEVNKRKRGKIDQVGPGPGVGEVDPSPAQHGAGQAPIRSPRTYSALRDKHSHIKLMTALAVPSVQRCDYPVQPAHDEVSQLHVVPVQGRDHPSVVRRPLLAR